MSYAICYMLNVICHMLYAICYMLYAICYIMIMIMIMIMMMYISRVGSNVFPAIVREKTGETPRHVLLMLPRAKNG